MYTAQVPANDLSRERAQKHKVPIYPTIQEALTMGGTRLAVDGVLLIGEHGDYPTNEKGQKLYPRFQFFVEITDVFRKTGSAVPLFNDKHLSYSWAKAKRMVEISRELHFPMLAGSSVPVAYRKPQVETPLGARVRHAVAVGYGGLEIYGFHLLESLQCMVERRGKGETGVAGVQCLENDAVWAYLDKNPWAQKLFERAIANSETRTAGNVRELVKTPSVFLIDYRDGLKAAAFLMTGAVTGLYRCAGYRRRGRAAIAADVARRTACRSGTSPAWCERSRRCSKPARRHIRWSARCSPAASSTSKWNRAFAGTSGFRRRSWTCATVWTRRRISVKKRHEANCAAVRCFCRRDEIRGAGLPACNGGFPAGITADAGSKPSWQAKACSTLRSSAIRFCALASPPPCTDNKGWPSMIYSRSAEYAIRSFVYLARIPDGKFAMVQHIAEEEKIPAHFLAKILQQLTRKGLLRSNKGPTGGFSLRVPASQITLLDLVEALDGQRARRVARITTPLDPRLLESPAFAYHGLFGAQYDRGSGQGSRSQESGRREIQTRQASRAK